MWWPIVMAVSIRPGRRPAANRMPDMPIYNDRIMAYVEEMQRKDLRITQCITDATGDRSLPPGKRSDPDSYCRVVERRADGVLIRGAKLHMAGASLGHEAGRGQLRHRLSRRR